MKFKPLAILPLVIVLSLASACQERPPEPPEAMPTQDPILTLGHGMFFGPDGEALTPNVDFILRAQRYYLAALGREGKSGDSQGERTRRLIDDLVEDEILANALFLDWLIETRQPENLAHLTSVNNALRWHYVIHIQTDGVLPEDHEWSKGIPREIARKLEDAGIRVFLKTNAGGRAYVEECRNNGVPIPEFMFSSEWDFRGAITNDFLSGASSQAEVWRHTSSSPEGVCLALPRYTVNGGTVGDDALPLGIICLGTQTSKACFLDNPRGRSFRRDVQVSINEFLGGVDLVNNGQGICTDCHAGENPFVVHPDDTPFLNLSSSLMPLAWYDPLVDASWPPNPGPSNLLAGEPSPGRCDSCHDVGGAGRFPDVSNQLPGYCNAVLATAMGTTVKATMPRPPLDRADYVAHIAFLQNACGNPPSVGVVVDFEAPDDRSFVSPPIVIDPLYQCATKVAVRGARLDAKLSLFINGSLVGSRTVRNPDLEEFDVAALVVNDVVTAQQEADGVLSLPSAAVTVRDHKVDYPSGLPTPEIDPTLIYECAEVISVRHVPGATVTVFSNGTDPRAGSGGGDWTIFRPAKRPFAIGDTFTAQQALCDDDSLVSGGASAVAEPSSIPAPTFNPADTYAGQELVTIETLVNGSRTNVEKVGTGSLGEFTTPVSWKPNFDVATPAGGALSAGDQLGAQQALCSKGPEVQTPPAQDCSALPAPRIAHPIAGQNYVVVTQSVPGATIRVYDATNDELGDSSGTVIALERAITASDTLTVVQQVGACTSSTGYRVSVRNAGSKPDG